MTGDEGDLRPVVSLSEVRLQPREDVVEFLESLLELARSGHARGVAVAMTTASRGTASGYVVGDGNLADLHYSMSAAQVRLLDGHRAEKG